MEPSISRLTLWKKQQCRSVNYATKIVIIYCKLLTNFATDLGSGLGNSISGEWDLVDLNFRSQPRCMLGV